jgi:GNAT superfamily N-acetyltransferase
MTATPRIQVRSARVSDASTILRFIQALADYEKLSDQVTATPETLARTLFGERPEAEALIAELDGAPVGFALFFHNYSTFLSRKGLYLEDLFVLPEARGQGAGKALFLHLAKLAVERGCGRMEWSVLDWNQPSIEFYKALGAVAMDEWTVYRLTGDSLHRLGSGEA